MIEHSLAHWWPLGAVIFSFIGALIIGFNQWAQLESKGLLVSRFAGVAPLAVLCAYLWPWPVGPQVYVAGFLMGLLLAFADDILHHASATYGCRLAALYVPLKMFLAFAVWLILIPGNAYSLFNNPLHLAAILGCFALATWALANIRANDASWKALLAVVPVAIIFAGADVLAKWLVPPLTASSLAPTLGAIAAYLASAHLAAVGVGLLKLKSWPAFTCRQWVLSATFGALLYCGIGFLLVVIIASPNPGYVAAITMLSALWLALWARWHGEKNNTLAGFLLLFSALGIALVGVH
jgi:hypothetical protein